MLGGCAKVFLAEIRRALFASGEQGRSMHYIFEVTAKPGYSIDEYAKGWQQASEHIQQAPGARGTRLHRKIGEPNKALAIATWDSKASRDAMEAKPSDTVRSIIEAQMPFVDIALIGEFDAPEWTVLPVNYEGHDLAHLDN